MDHVNWMRLLTPWQRLNNIIDPTHEVPTCQGRREGDIIKEDSTVDPALQRIGAEPSPEGVGIGWLRLAAVGLWTSVLLCL